MDYPTAPPMQSPASFSPNPASGGEDLPEAPPLGRKQPVAQMRIAITALHECLLIEPDPEDKQVFATCLQNLIRLQAKNQKQSQQGGR
jgi:hypothetical protein